MKKAFTLIELLVVIAIIAILAALLMPALQRAREEAHKTTCRNNVHNAGIAFNLYLNDSKGIWPGWCSDWVNNQAYFRGVKDARSTDGDPFYQFVKKGYLDDVKIFDCPTADNPTWGVWYGPRALDDWGEWGDGEPETVMFNEYAYDLGRIARDSVPGRVVYGDSPERRDAWSVNSWPYNHAEGSNLLYVDQAVEFSELKDAEEPQYTVYTGWGDWNKRGWTPNPRMDEDAYRARIYIKNGLMSGTPDSVEAQLSYPSDRDCVYLTEGTNGGWVGTNPLSWSWATINPTDPNNAGGSDTLWNNSKLPPDEPDTWWGASRVYHFWADADQRAFFPEVSIFAKEPRWDTHDACLIPLGFQGVPGSL